MKKGKWTALAVAVAALSSVAIACDNAGKNEHQHTWGEWAITTDPTETTGGVATRYCTDDNTPDTFDLPKLTDTTFWTVDTENSVNAGHGTAGKIIYTSEYGDVEVSVPAEAHTYGDWTITKAPTLNDKGTAKRVCTADQTPDEVEIAALSDTSVWTKNTEKSEAATHFKAGKDVYTSVYGEVNVEIKQIAHTYGDWTITDEPTLTDKGTAERECTEDQTKDTVEVAALSDTSVWTKKEYEADYNAGGRTEYTSVYGTIVKENPDAPKLPAPYDNKTYYGLALSINNSAKVTLETSWCNQNVALDENGKGVCEGALFGASGKELHVVMLDYSKGLIRLDCDGKQTAGYLDAASGIFVYARTPLSTISTEPVIAMPSTFIAFPEGYDDLTDIQKNDAVKTIYLANAKASAWSVDGITAIAASYKVNETTYNLFIYDDEVYFGVEFKNGKGAGANDVAADECYNAAYLYVKKGDDVIAAFAYTGEEMVETDGLEGSYTGKLNADDETETTLRLSGFGTFANLNNATYDVAVGEDYTIGAYIGGEYFEVTLGDGTFTAVKPMVTITRVTEYGLSEEDKVKTFNKNISIALGDLEDPEGVMHFGGWFTDEARKKPVVLTSDGGYIPTADVTLYAKWSKKVIIKTVVGGVETSIEYGEGDDLKSKLPKLGVDEDNDRMFVGWYLDANFTKEADINAAVNEKDTGIKIYAKFAPLPAYYGERTGKQLLSDSTTKRAEITIDERGKISGSIFTGEKDSQGESLERAVTGTVNRYDPATGRITYTTDGGDTRYMWLDAETGLLVVPNDLGNDEIDTNPFVLAKSGVTIGDNVSFDFHNGGFGASKTFMIALKYSDNSDKLALIYNDRIYGNVTVTGVLGTEEYNVDNVEDAKSIVVKNSKGGIIVAYGTTAEKFSSSYDNMGQLATVKALDAVYGAYTDATNGTVVLDGVGGLTGDLLTQKSAAANLSENQKMYASYAPAADGNGYDVYFYTVTVVTSEDDDYSTPTKTYTKVLNEYYKLTLGAEKSCTIVKTMVKLTYDVNLPQGATGTDGVTGETLDINANIAFDLTKKLKTIDNYVFEGWYSDAACTQKLTSVNIAANTSVYAKWLTKRTLTLHVNLSGATELDPVYVGDGLTADIDDPNGVEGVSFIGWYTDAECTQAWNATAPVTANIELWAKWGMPIYAQEYRHFVLANNNSVTGNTNVSGQDKKNTGGVVSFDVKGNVIVNKDASNKPISNGYPFNTDNHQIVDFDEINGTFIFVSNSSNNAITRGRHKGFIDLSTGMVVFSRDVDNADFIGNYLLVPNSFGNVEAYSGSYWNNFKTRVVILTTTNNGVHSVFVHNNHVYFDVTFKTADGTDVAGNACYTSPTLYVRDKAGSLIAKFGYDGTVMNELDGYEDITYTGELGSLTVNGVSVVTAGDKTGTYSLAQGADYTADAYIDGSYYELTLDKTAQTYTAVKRMVTLNYDTDYDVVHAVNGEVNKNIGITLPVLTDANNVFRGWYTDEACTTAVTLTDGKFVPTEAATTLYAKWDAKVVLTVVYATIQHDGITGMPNAVKEYGAGDSITLDEPAFTNGKAFGGWYTDAQFTTTFEATTISANTTVYCKWIDSVAMYGTYYGWNLYSTSSGDKTSGFSTTYTIDPDGTVKKGTSVIGKVAMKNGAFDYDPSTGIFYVEETNGTKSYFVYDAVSGALCVGNTRKESDFKSYDLDLMFKKTITKVEYSALLGTKVASDTGSGWLLTVTFDDNSTVNVYATNTRIYGGVTWTATDADGNAATYSAKNVGNAATVTIYDKDGNVIAKRGKDGSTWKELDDWVGEYNGDLGKLTFNGVGGVKLDGVEKAGTYTITSGGEYTADVTVNNNYYRVTLNKTGNTYTYTRPTAKIMFDLGGKGNNFEHDQNLNITLDLRNGDVIAEPTADGFVFDGWYSAAGGTGSRVWDIKPTTTDMQTVYAKWAAAYTLTINYKNGQTAETKSYKEGSSIALSSIKPETSYVDGKYFDGWYTDEDCTVAATFTTMSQNEVIYAKWTVGSYKIEPAAIDSTNTYGFEYVEDGQYYKSTNQGQNSTNCRMTITAYAAGKISFKYQASSEAESKWDYMKITVDDSQKATAGGANGLSSGDGPADDGWKTFEFDLTEGQVVSIIFIKDSSSQGGADTGWVKDIAFTPAA